MQSQGWYRDPYGNHDDRWFSDGKATSLVRDRGTESYDDPPQDRPPPGPPSPSPVGYPLAEHLFAAWPAKQRESLHWWTVLLPGVLTLSAWGLVWFIGVIPIIIVIALLGAGLSIREYRPAIALTLWVAFVLSLCLIPLLLNGLATAFNWS